VKASEHIRLIELSASANNVQSNGMGNHESSTKCNAEFTQGGNKSLEMAEQLEL